MEAAVITGLGAIGGYGAAPKDLLDALESGRPRLRPIDRSEGFHCDGSARMASLVPPEALAKESAPSKTRRMSPPSRMACAAAVRAMAQARLAFEQGTTERAGVCLGTAFGANSYTLELLKEILEKGPATASPFLFIETVANAHAAQIAIAAKARGPNITITQRESGGLLAIARAVDQLRAGRCDVALAGSVDEMAPIVHAALDRFGALARPNTDGQELARPFGRNRNGMLVGEGACVLVIEPATAARARGANVLGRIALSVRGNDPTAPAHGWGRGHELLAPRLASGLERAGIALGDIDLVVSGASGAINGDRLEARVLRAVWGKRELPPIVTPKAVTGEYGGGFLAAAILSLASPDFGPVSGSEDPDPELGLRLPCDHVRPKARRILASSLAAGGAAVWLVLERA